MANMEVIAVEAVVAAEEIAQTLTALDLHLDAIRKTINGDASATLFHKQIKQIYTLLEKHEGPKPAQQQVEEHFAQELSNELTSLRFRIANLEREQQKQKDKRFNLSGQFGQW